MTLLRYWTTRYVITLCIGLLIIAIVSVWWIRQTTIEHRLNLTIFMAEELADRIVSITEGRPITREKAPGLLQERRMEHRILIVDTNGVVLSDNRLVLIRGRATIPLELLESNKQVERIQLDTENPVRYYMVKAPIETSDLQLGWVVILQPEQEVVQIDQEYRLLAIMLVSLALLGWVAVYFVSRKLSHPIQHVAQAAQQVQQGNYDIDLPENIKEQEVFELVHSFKEMAERLQQLEAMRTELLAGVTHELKTPVTSISGLLQAVKDDVVKGEEAKEFLEISLKETSRLQKMVADLLAFNSFAANKVPMTKEDHSINELISEIIHAWSAIQNDQSISLQLTLLEKDRIVSVDPMRLQQIIENVLNNAKQSIEDKGTIAVSLFYRLETKQIEITLKDSGIGIPKEEQYLIFERFYRGENKKYKVRGLGLGLPFSKMIANALGGDLTLIESSTKGTTFRIVLPVKSN